MCCIIYTNSSVLRTPIVSLTTTSSPLTTMPIPLRLALISVTLIVLSQIPWRKIELPTPQVQSAPEIIKKPKIDHYTAATLPEGIYRVELVVITPDVTKFYLHLVNADTGAKLPFPLRLCTLKQSPDREEIYRLEDALVIADKKGVDRFVKREF